MPTEWMNGCNLCLLLSYESQLASLHFFHQFLLNKCSTKFRHKCMFAVRIYTWLYVCSVILLKKGRENVHICSCQLTLHVCIPHNYLNVARFLYCCLQQWLYFFLQRNSRKCFKIIPFKYLGIYFSENVGLFPNSNGVKMKYKSVSTEPSWTR